MQKEYLKSMVELNDFFARGTPHKQVQHGQVINLLTFVLEDVFELIAFVFLVYGLVHVFKLVDVV